RPRTKRSRSWASDSGLVTCPSNNRWRCPQRMPADAPAIFGYPEEDPALLYTLFAHRDVVWRLFVKKRVISPGSKARRNAGRAADEKGMQRAAKFRHRFSLTAAALGIRSRHRFWDLGLGHVFLPNDRPLDVRLRSTPDLVPSFPPRE